MTQIEKGAASIFIELENGNITVKHGTDGHILHKVIDAEEGSWDKIWNTIRNIRDIHEWMEEQPKP